ncbi:MAG: helix-hairpin-helix domain-containing protein [Patescibacteria group bacterium]
MEEFLNRNSKLIIFSLLGLILIGLGVLSYKIDIFSSGDTVEVLNSTNAGPESPQDEQGNIVVEISGAVEKPGVYKLKNGSRIDDLLISAGGISSDADRLWVEKNINRAAKLIDGQKLYIYHLGEVSAKNTGSIKLDQEVLGVSNQNLSNLVNINTASQSELEKLVGIGPVYAQKIVEGRIYSNTEELVKRQIIPQKTFQKIQNEISVY